MRADTPDRTQKMLRSSSKCKRQWNFSRHAQIVPFGSTRHPRYQPSEDANLLALLDALVTRTVTIVGKSWKLHVTDVLRVTAEENIELN